MPLERDDYTYSNRGCSFDLAFYITAKKKLDKIKESENLSNLNIFPSDRWHHICKKFTPNKIKDKSIWSKLIDSEL